MRRSRKASTMEIMLLPSICALVASKQLSYFIDSIENRPWKILYFLAWLDYFRVMYLSRVEYVNFESYLILIQTVKSFSSNIGLTLILNGAYNFTCLRKRRVALRNRVQNAARLGEYCTSWEFAFKKNNKLCWCTFIGSSIEWSESHQLCAQGKIHKLSFGVTAWIPNGFPAHSVYAMCFNNQNAFLYVVSKAWQTKTKTIKRTIFQVPVMVTVEVMMMVVIQDWAEFRRQLPAQLKPYVSISWRWTSWTDCRFWGEPSGHRWIQICSPSTSRSGWTGDKPGTTMLPCTSQHSWPNPHHYPCPW